jgi:hypothetical protein
MIIIIKFSNTTIHYAILKINFFPQNFGAKFPSSIKILSAILHFMHFHTLIKPQPLSKNFSQVPSLTLTLSPRLIIFLLWKGRRYSSASPSSPLNPWQRSPAPLRSIAEPQACLTTSTILNPHLWLFLSRVLLWLPLNVDKNQKTRKKRREKKGSSRSACETDDNGGRRQSCHFFHLASFFSVLIPFMVLFFLTLSRKWK